MMRGSGRRSRRSAGRDALMCRLHPRAGERHPETVADDVDPFGARVVEHRVDEALQIGDVRDGGVREARSDRRIAGEIALVTLVAEAPELRRRVAVIGEVPTVPCAWFP